MVLRRNKVGTVCIESTQVLDSAAASVAPARVLNSDELSDHERGGHVRKV